VPADQRDLVLLAYLRESANFRSEILNTNGARWLCRLIEFLQVPEQTDAKDDVCLRTKQGQRDQVIDTARVRLLHHATC